jgi:16S rRNA (uracil1498-N3)-methyltransferase
MAHVATGDAPDGRHGPHVFVDDLGAPLIGDDDRHHLGVLRIRTGDPITVSDGAGRWRPARFGPTIEPAGEITVVPRSTPAVTVAFAPVKGDRPEWVVQKLTELGVDRIVPIETERSVVRWRDDRATSHTARLQRISREAAMQSRQCYLPEIALPLGFARASVLPGACLAHRDGRPPSLEHPAVLVGPEGGWSDRELDAGLPRVRLSGAVLRAETAAIAAGVLLTGLRSALVGRHVG